MYCPFIVTMHLSNCLCLTEWWNGTRFKLKKTNVEQLLKDISMIKNGNIKTKMEIACLGKSGREMLRSKKGFGYSHPCMKQETIFLWSCKDDFKLNFVHCWSNLLHSTNLFLHSVIPLLMLLMTSVHLCLSTTVLKTQCCWSFVACC